MALAGRLELEFAANIARLQSDTAQAKGIVSNMARDMNQALGTVRSAFGALGVGLSVGALAAVVKGSVDAMDALDDLSKTTRIAATELSGLGFAAKMGGTDLQATTQAINILAREMGKDAEKFRALGITAKEPIEAFKQLADLSNALVDPQQRAAVMSELLGRSWERVAPLLAEGSEKIGELVEKGKELSGVTEESVAQAAKLNDALDELAAKGVGGVNTMVAKLLPVLNEMVSGFGEASDGSSTWATTGEVLAEVLRAIVVLGGNVGFVLKGIGTEAVTIAAQFVALADAVARFKSGDIAGARDALAAFNGIGDEATKNAEAARAAFDAWEQRMMGLGTAAGASREQLSGLTEEQLEEQRIATEAAAALLKSNEEKRAAEKAAAEAAKEAAKMRALSTQQMLEQIDAEIAAYEAGLTAEAAALDALRAKEKATRKLSAAEWVKHIDAMVDAYEDGLQDIARVTPSAMQATEAALKDIDSFLAVDKAQAWGEAMSTSFGQAGNALMDLISTLDLYGQKEAQIAAEREKLSKIADPIARAQREMQLTEASSRNQIRAYASMAGAAKGFFAENSKGYKILEAAERGFTAFQLASDLIKGFSKAKIAVLTQGEGDPYSAWARMAAMAAVVAGLGFAVGGIGGGGSAPEAGSVRRQREQGTGTVLGDPEAKSESIANALEILRDNSSEELLFQSKMLASLVSIESSMMGMAAAVARAGLTGRNVTLPENEGGSWWGLGGSNTFSLDDMGIILGRVLTPNNSDPGQAYGGQTVQQIITGALGTVFTDIRRDHGGFRSYSATNREHDPLGDALIRDIGRTVGAMRDAIAEAIFILSDGAMSLEEVRSRLNAINIDPTTISFADLAGGEIQDALMAVFSSIGDTMVTDFLGSLGSESNLAVLADFQRVGEGAFETLIRVASGIESARAQLDQWGIDMIRWQDIVNTQGDVTTELLRDSIVRSERGTGGELTGVGQIIQGFDGSAEDLIRLFDKLLDIRVLLRAVGADGNDLSQAMITAAGGVSAFANALNTYFSEFFTAEEQLAAKTEELRGQFADLGLEMPTTREAFRAMVEAAKAAGDDTLYGALIRLAPAFADITDSVIKAADTIIQHPLYSGDQKSLTDKLLGGFNSSIGGVLGGQGSLADQMSLKIAAGADQIELWQARAKEIEAVLGATADRSPEYQALAAAIKKVTAESKALGIDLAQLTILTAQYGEEKAEELFELQKWYEDQKKIIGGNQAAMLALEKLYAERREDILKSSAEQSVQDIINAQSGLREWLDGLLLNDQLSPLTPQQKLAEARKQYEEMLAAAQGGDAAAIAGLAGASDAFLSIAREIFASSAGYQAIFDQIKAEVGGVAGMAPEDFNSQMLSALPTNGRIASGQDIADLKMAVYELTTVLVQRGITTRDPETAQAVQEVGERFTASANRGALAR